MPHNDIKHSYNSVAAALDVILPTQQNDTVLIVFGSFFTVAGAIDYFKK